MRFVPIPPTALIDWTVAAHEAWFPSDRSQQMHFCLAHEMLEDITYISSYKGLSKIAHVIMDNGAFETGQSMTIAGYVNWVREIEPSEVVLPDRMFMADTTSAIARETFLTWFRNDDTICFQGVVHGRNPGEWYECLKNYAWMAEVLPKDRFIIGIPKDYEAWPGGREALAAMVPEQWRIHLLGWERQMYLPYFTWVKCKKSWEQAKYRIRSIDTAKPYIYAYWGIEIPEPADTLEESEWLLSQAIKKGKTTRVVRPKDYFQIPSQNFDLGLVRHNLNIFAALAGAL